MKTHCQATRRWRRLQSRSLSLLLLGGSLLGLTSCAARELVCGKELLHSEPYASEISGYCTQQTTAAAEREPLLAPGSMQARSLQQQLLANFERRVGEMSSQALTDRSQGEQLPPLSRGRLARACASVAYLHVSKTGGTSLRTLMQESQHGQELKYWRAARDDNKSKRNASCCTYFQPNAPPAHSAARVNFYELHVEVFHLLSPAALVQRLQKMRQAEQARGCALWVVLSVREPEGHFYSQWRWSLKMGRFKIAGEPQECDKGNSLIHSLSQFLASNQCEGLNMQATQIAFGSEAHADTCNEISTRLASSQRFCGPETTAAWQRRAGSECPEFWRAAYDQLLQLYSFVDFPLVTGDNALSAFFFCTVLQLQIHYCHLGSSRAMLERHGEHVKDALHAMPHSNTNGGMAAWYHNDTLRATLCPAMSSDVQRRTGFDANVFQIFSEAAEEIQTLVRSS